MKQRITPDDLKDPRDAGCCTGVVNLNGSDVSRSDLSKGFTSESTPYDPFEYENPESQVSPATDRGFLSRPGGWER